MRNINLEYYKIFYHVVKTGSFTGAADILCITQPAVSQAVKLMEQELGSRLFLRTGKGVKLTPEGAMLYGYVEKGYEAILSGENQLAKIMEYESGEIRIGASDMTLKYYLLPYLEKFHEEYPKIKVTVTNAPTPETIRYLNEEKIDFGIVSEPFDNKYNIKASKVKTIEDIFVAGRKFSHLARRTIGLKDLEQMPIICLEGNTSTRKYMDDFLAENQVVLKPEFELATSDMIVQFALRNLGVGCVVSEFAKDWIDEGRLSVLKFNCKIPKRNFCIITSEKNAVSAAARKLLDKMI